MSERKFGLERFAESPTSFQPDAWMLNDWEAATCNPEEAQRWRDDGRNVVTPLFDIENPSEQCVFCHGAKCFICRDGRAPVLVRVDEADSACGG